MPLTSSIFESLPYIDTEPTPSERNAAQVLISAELPQNAPSHPSLPPLAPSNPSPLLESLIADKLARLPSKTPLAAIDLSRYESLSPPENNSLRDGESLNAWREALQAAYTSHAYLSHRLSTLSSLEAHGKNAWLLGNSQLEEVLKGLEKELAERKEEIDICVIERKNAQEEKGAEIRGLEEGWKRGVGRVLETEVAAEGVRREVLGRRREGAL